MDNYDYLIRRKFFSILGQKFSIFNNHNKLIAFCQQKAFKLKEDIRLYTDESKTKEIIKIKARNIIDFSACYDVYSSDTNEHLGSWRRKGFSSIIRDEWEVLDSQGNVISKLKEDSMSLALVRRFLTNWIPQEFHLGEGNTPMAKFSQCFNPIIYKLKVSISPNSNLNPFLIIAGAILISAIEGRQE